LRSVYLLQSTSSAGQRHVGVTSDLRKRLKEHNAGRVLHTARYRPWEAVVALRFEDGSRAVQFARYLKSGSRRASANRRFW